MFGSYEDITEVGIYKKNKKVRKKERKYSLEKKATKKTIKKKNDVFLGRVLGRERVKKNHLSN